MHGARASLVLALDAMRMPLVGIGLVLKNLGSSSTGISIEQSS